jgi:hypothetical protein
MVNVGMLFVVIVIFNDLFMSLIKMAYVGSSGVGGSHD